MAHALLCITTSDRLSHWRSVLPSGLSLVTEPSLGAAAERLSRGESFVAAVVDVGEAPLRAELASLRAVEPLLPFLVVLRSPCGESLNAAHMQRAEVVCGLPEASQVDGFLNRVVRVGRLETVDVQAWIEHLLDTRQLRGSDAELLPVVLGEETREHASERLGFTDTQMTRRLRALCRRCGARTTLGAARNLMRDALVLGRPQRLVNEQGAPQFAMSRVA